MSGVTCQVSRVRCQMSGVMYHVFVLFFLLLCLDKFVELVGGGSVINEAYPFYFI